MKRYAPLLLLYLLSCTSPSQQEEHSAWHEIQGRDGGHHLERPILYRALVPIQWKRKDPSPDTSIHDTTLSNCEYIISDNEGEVRITIHTFPFEEDAARIPPQAQIARWKKQLEPLDILSVQIISEAHGGFTGLFFEGNGILNGKPAAILGWSMQLAPLYSHQLRWDNPIDHVKHADYTIKATGPSFLIRKYRTEIIQFANSFELIDDLPTP